MFDEDEDQGTRGARALGHATSPALVELMRGAQAAQEDDDLRGSIDIETSLSYTFGSWSARFKVVGPEGSYVMRSVSEFVERMRTGERFSYGKKLTFTHVPAMLTERGRALVRFMERAVREQIASRGWNRWSASGAVGRDLELAEEQTAELLGILEGTSFDVTGVGGGTRAITHAHVERLEPKARSKSNGTRAADPSAAQNDAPGTNPKDDASAQSGRAANRDEGDAAPTPNPLGIQLVLGEGGCRITCPKGGILVSSPTAVYLWREETFLRLPDRMVPYRAFLSAVFDREAGAPFVSAADLPRFCATLLPAIEGPLALDVPPELAALKPVPCELRFYFDRERLRAGDWIVCEAKAAYGDTEFRVGARENEEGAPLRDARREAKAERLVERYFGPGQLPAPARIPLESEAQAGALLFGGLAEFRKLGEVLTTPAFNRLLRETAPRVTFGVALSGDLINLMVSAGDLAPAELAALLSSYRQRKHYHRLRDGAYLNLEDCDLSQLDRMATDLGITQTQLASGKVELPSFRAFYLDEEENLDRDRSFTRYLERFQAVSEESYRVPAPLEDVLRPYQAEGFRWLSARVDADFGGILADEMGLGKSVQLIALLLARRSEAQKVGPSLIVCPASLVYNWLAEFERFAPTMRAVAVSGTKATRRQALASPADVYVTSYDTLRIDADAFGDRTYYCCALDEAQYIKNPATRTTRAVKRMRAQHRFALTGTPLENRLSDLWSIFDFLMPGLLGPYTRFRERFELPIAGGDEDVAARLRALAGPFLLRRRKSDVLADLPEKLESTVYVALEGEQRRLYDACEQQLRERLTEQRRVKGGRGKAKPVTPEARAAAATAQAAGDDFAKHRVEILAELTRLRQICCDPALLFEDYNGPAAKLSAIADLVDAAHEGGEKTLVFSQFTSFLELIAEQLDARGIPYFSITGATPKRKRLELVDAFNADDTPAFLVSLKAGGTGLNLTGASVVIHADPWWNAAAQNQATDRAHRIGQTRAVTVQKVIAKGTIEERIQRLQQAKADLADQVIGASGTSLSGMTREDLLELLELLEG